MPWARCAVTAYPRSRCSRDVLRWQDCLARRRGSEAVDHDGAVAPDVGDPPAVAVLDPPAAASSGGVRSLLARDDDVPDRGSAAVGQVDLVPIDGAVEQQPFGSGAFVERADVAGRLGHEDAGRAGGAVGAPGDVRGVDHLVRDALADALLTAVGRDDLDVAAAQREGRVPSPTRW